MSLQRTLIVYCEKFAIGGTETLILRIGAKAAGNNIRVLLLTEVEIEDRNLVSSLLLAGIHIYNYSILKKNFLSTEGHVLSVGLNDDVLFLFFYFPEFFNFWRMRRRFFKFPNLRFLIYIVHPRSTFLFSHKVPFLNMLVRIFIKNSIYLKIIKFMDEETILATENNYRMKLPLAASIVRLPIVISQSNPKKFNENLKILTISRFEFPFKGYVLGLIADFEVFNRRYPNSTLTIIGHGPGEGRVLDLIKRLPISIQQNINLIQRVPIELIDSYLDSCDVYVGMGTTVLSAANRYKIVISAIAYQESSLASGFFHNKPEQVAVVASSYEGATFTFSQLLEEVAKMSIEERTDLGLISYNHIKELYNLDRNVLHLLNYEIAAVSKQQRYLIGAISTAYGWAQYLTHQLRRFRFETNRDC